MKITLPAYLGFTCFVTNGVSYECPKLALYGFSTERSLHSAIKRKQKKTGIEPDGVIGYMQGKGAA